MAAHVDVVLDDVRDARQQAERLTACTTAVETTSRVDRPLGVHMDQRVNLAIARCNGLEMRIHDLVGGQFSRGDQSRDLNDGQ
jgi:hypothetical protein